MKREGYTERSRRRAVLMTEAQRGNAVSYAELLGDIGPIVMSFLRRRVRDDTELDELAGRQVDVRRETEVVQKELAGLQHRRANLLDLAWTA